MDIRKTSQDDEPAIRQVHEAAFGPEEGPVIADLVAALLHDPTAAPFVSLLACEASEAIGHVLFTHVRIDGADQSPAASILAPLAVVPERQRDGVGAQLVREGLDVLAAAGCELVFVLGHPEYYPRFGFQPAGRLGLDAPYPIAERNAGAWMVLALREGVIGRVSGTVKCAAALDREAFWVE